MEFLQLNQTHSYRLYERVPLKLLCGGNIPYRRRSTTLFRQQVPHQYLSFYSQNIIYLSEDAGRDFDNCLFLIEVDGNKLEFKVAIEYDQPIYLRHKISQKYLSVTVDDEEEDGDIRYKLVLSSERKHFKINPCYQYQTKISTKIKFNQEIYLSTEYTQSRQGLIVVDKKTNIQQLLLGFSRGSKFLFQFYTSYQKQEKHYKAGRIVWLSHIESENFLSVQTNNGREEAVFESIHYDKQIQNLQALWTIESNDVTKSDHLKYDQTISFKNLYSGQYLCFSRNYKLVDNERIYQIYLQDNPEAYGKFMFKSIKQKQTRQIQKNSYLSLLHYESSLYLGCRRQQQNRQTAKVLTFAYMQDEDLFRINEFSAEEEQALRFIFAIRREFKEIAKNMHRFAQEITSSQIQQIQQTYTNIKREFEALRKFEKLFDFVRNELGSSINFIVDNLSGFRSLAMEQGAESTIRSKNYRIQSVSHLILQRSYEIICILCEGHSSNQNISYNCVAKYLVDVANNLGAEEALMATFRNNSELLPRVARPLGKDGNIVRMLLLEFKRKRTERDQEYWKGLAKAMKVIKVLLYLNGSTLDMNQYIISDELFKKGLYEQIFLPISVQGERICIFQAQKDQFTPIEQVRQVSMNDTLQCVLQMFSDLTSNHSYNSKHYIHKYLSARNHACLSVLIAYLNKPIRKQLYNKLINFLAKTYLDSSPRLKRQKPLAFVFFNFEEQTKEVQKDVYQYSNMKEMAMLKAEESKVCKRTHYSNLVSMGDSAQPSMSQEQLVTFRLNLTEKLLSSNQCSIEQLQTVSLLMKLQCYTTNQMLQIYEQLKNKLTLGGINSKIVPKILQIIQQLFTILQELQMKKMTTYLLYKFLQDKDLSQDEYKYILPLSSRIFIPFQPNTAVNQIDPMETSNKNRQVLQYNQLRDTLDLMHASAQFKLSLMNHFCNYKHKQMNEAQASSYLQSVFKLILQSNLPKERFLKLLSKSTILTNEEVGDFDRLFEITKRIQYLILISESWMLQEGSAQNQRLFLKYLNEMITYMLDSGQNSKKSEKVNIKKQLLMGSLNVHLLVLELLQKNYYLLQNTESRKDMKRKSKEVFESCFTFIHHLIKQCPENKRIIYEYFSILMMYQKRVELGQIKVYHEFYRGQKDFVKQINFSFIENVIFKIIKKAGVDFKSEICEYNPEYIKLIIVLMQSLDIQSKFLVQRLYSFITKKDILSGLLFMDDSAKRNKINQFCLLMRKIKIEPLQVPILYHLELIRLFNIILTSSSESIRNAFKIKLSQIFKINYLISVLSEPDVFSNTGIQPKLMFVLKKELIVFVQKLLQKNEFYAEIYESEQLMGLLQFYSKIFRPVQLERREISSEGESLYIPFIEKYQDYIDECLKDKAAYYNEQVKPLLRKLLKIFEKQSRAADNTLRTYLISLYQRLQQDMKVNISKKTTSFTESYGLKDMKLKWRNFVDDDEDNSKEEKYAKKNILDILKSEKAQKIIKQELTAFYELIRSNSKLFVNSMIKLLSILFSTRNVDDGRTKQSQAIEQTLKYLSGYIAYVTDPKQAKFLTDLLEQNRFLEICIELTIRKQFELSKMHLKNIFYYCLKIINFLLSRDGDYRFQKLMLKIFQEKQASQKFLEFLKMGAMQIISSIDSNQYQEQINSALEEMSLCVDSVPLQLYEEAYRMLTFLCRFQPFTTYLRSQQRQNQIDFLDKIYNVVTFVFNDQKQLNRSIKVSTVRATEYILDFVSSMFTGGNEVNQNYIVDSKFASFVNSVLKIDSLQAVTAQRNIRSELLDGIIEFYRGNGIEISDLLHQKIKLIDFKHVYLLNRFKYILLKTLLQCLIGNRQEIAKLKLQIPIEVIKLNLIWIYEFYKTNKYEYDEIYILRKREDWKHLVENQQQIRPLYLRLGFFYYQLILIYEGSELNNDDADIEEKIVNEEKEKERVVKKFFKTILDKDRKSQKESALDVQKLSEEMKQYYHMYYNARIFFAKHTSTIEVNLKGELLTVYFPILPIAIRINQEMEEQFIDGVNRLSRGEKIKSLLQYQNSFYEDLKGQDDYFSEVQARMPALGGILRVMKQQNEFNLIAWIISVILCLTFLIQNFRTPSFLFAEKFFFYITPTGSNPLVILMLLFSLLSLSMGVISGFYLFTRKIPLLKKLESIKYSRLSPQMKQGVMQSETAFLIKKIAAKTVYNFYMVLFLVMSTVHPFFSAFPLVEVINRIEMGRFIIKSIKQTWFQLLATCGLLIVFNIVFVQIIYDFFTTATTYGPICTNLFTCMLLVTDGTLKGGQGFLGVVSSYYVNSVLTGQLICEILYIIFGIGVLTQIFYGTIIDKFSQLREKEESIAQDQKTVCFICAQERFDLDLEYEGFELHIEKNHNPLNYIKFLFYMRRYSVNEYGIIERYVHQCKLKDSEEWIPEHNSVFKQEKEREDQEEEQEDFKRKHQFYWQGKFKEMKNIHTRLETMIKDLRGGIKKTDNRNKLIND